ncbi:Protein of unknown function DUF262 [Mucilaginibacter mallensis]|uniref:GmrSD restriction endonucleases N-terminal domain-containing protein n=1 Tax=Mucilaginibacter mallensis TaxID=652787 RepID=A0A1H2BQM1_MUCMA|nr:DUF262 domain-containing protein [Mucilaginibacter mallensis]SDT60414.1 Protein of unknown function DUF262 [Mucilaginibacter mallensis]
MAKRKLQENNLADILFPTLSEEELSESIINIPPEQRRLHTETLDFSISTVIDSLTKGDMFIPEFQRRYVWSEAQASRLIESLIIQCPIPVIYLNQEKDEKLSVIDGNQRLLSLQKFIRNQFGLKGLTAYPELEGNKFYDLDPRFQRHILNRTLRCIVIAKDTHPQIKFDVFERLNSGSVKLTAQELRHGLYHGSFMKLVNELAKDKNWQKLINLSANKRMKSEELIIRFFAFHYNLENYKKPLANFLNEFCDANKELTEDKKLEYTLLFKRTIQNILLLFGSLAFKIFDKQLKPVNNFNAALFDAEMLSVSSYSEALVVKPSVSKILIKNLGEKFDEEEFIKTLSVSTSDKNPINKRVSIVDELVKAVL